MKIKNKRDTVIAILLSLPLFSVDKIFTLDSLTAVKVSVSGKMGGGINVWDDVVVDNPAVITLEVLESNDVVVPVK